MEERERESERDREWVTSRYYGWEGETLNMYLFVMETKDSV